MIEYCTPPVRYGWQCPVCGAVYAPDWPWCTVCTGQKTTTVTTTSVPGEAVQAEPITGDLRVHVYGNEKG